jgi:hypothetical protein
MTEFYFVFWRFTETKPSETGAHIYTLPTFYSRTVQFIVVYAYTSVQFDKGKPLLPNVGNSTYKYVQNYKYIHQYNIVCIVLAKTTIF